MTSLALTAVAANLNSTKHTKLKLASHLKDIKNEAILNLSQVNELRCNNYPKSFSSQKFSKTKEVFLSSLGCAHFIAK